MTALNSDALRARIDGVQKLALGVGVLGAIGAGVGWSQDATEFFRSYLFSFLFWMAFPLGCLGLTLVHTLTGGNWGIAARRVLHAGMRTLPLTALFFIVVGVGLHQLYEWSHADVVAADPILQHKSKYLNTTEFHGFYGRAVFYFLFWIGYAYMLSARHDHYERTRDEKYAATTRNLAGIGTLLFVLTVTFAVTDWAMSLEPHWFSTIYGVMFIVGQGLSTLAFTIVMSAWLAKSAPYSAIMQAKRYHDLGKLMFAFTLLWGYVTLAQFLIIWSANLPEETPWYLHRGYTSWRTILVALLSLHFALPFLILLSRKVKQNPALVSKIALFILVMRFVDMSWIIIPAFHQEGFHFHWLYLATPAAMGGLWVAFFMQQLKGRLASAPADSYLERALEVAPSHGH
ncbi:MAG: hypothetical protein L6Q99_10325 [Planctomycetes bacterium]|nr:hypothetical protein [Planctomycetota bacterium]